MKRLSIAAACLIAVLLTPVLSQAQATTRLPDCTMTLRTPGLAVMNAVGTSGLFDNRSAGCTEWTLTYTTYGWTAPTFEIVDAPNNNNSAGTAVAFEGSYLNGITQPVSGGSSGTISVVGYYPYMGVSVVSKSGTGFMEGTFYGFRNDASIGTLNGVTSVTYVGTSSASAAQVVATLPAVTGQFHYITAIVIERTCTSAITGSATLSYTTTNLPGSMSWLIGNACLIGSTNIDVSQQFNLAPIKSSVAGTATTITVPSAGAAGFTRINVWYYTGP
jgi:hypothetical protein